MVVGLEGHMVAACGSRRGGREGGREGGVKGRVERGALSAAVFRDMKEGTLVCLCAGGRAKKQPVEGGREGESGDKLCEKEMATITLLFSSRGKACRPT